MQEVLIAHGNAWNMAGKLFVILFLLFITLTFLIGILKVLQIGLNMLFGDN